MVEKFIIQTVRLEDVAYVNPRLSEKVDPSTLVSFVGMADLSADRAVTEAEDVRPYSEVAKGHTAFQNGDLLVAKITPCFENGKIGHAKLSYRLGFGSTEFHVVRPHQGLVDGRYLMHFLRSPKFRAEGEIRMTGSGGQRRVPVDYVKQAQLPLPPLEEQRRIAAILDKADELRNKRRQTLARLDVLSQSIFHGMFGDFSEGSSLWPRLPIGEVCSVIVDCVNRTAPLVEGPTAYKMIRTSNVRDREINLSSVRYVSRETFDVWNRRAIPQRGDVVLTREAPMGEAGQILFDDSVFLGQRTMLYRPNPHKLSAAYLLYYLTSGYMKRDFERHGSGSTVKHLSVPYCRSISVHLPPVELQHEFARRIAAIDLIKTRQRAQLAELDTLFASLQHRSFNGEL